MAAPLERVLTPDAEPSDPNCDSELWRGAGDMGTPTCALLESAGFGVDCDGDGYSVGEGDCDNRDRTVYPGARHRRDGKDNDCDGKIDRDERKPRRRS